MNTFKFLGKEYKIISRDDHGTRHLTKCINPSGMYEFFTDGFLQQLGVNII